MAVTAELFSCLKAASAAQPAAVGSQDAANYRGNYFLLSGGKLCQAMPQQETPGKGHCPEERLENIGEEVWPL